MIFSNKESAENIELLDKIDKQKQITVMDSNEPSQSQKIMSAVFYRRKV